MSLIHFVTQAHHLPELELDPPADTDSPASYDGDYTAEHAREQLAAEMAAARLSAPPVEPDPDGARLIAEYAADKLAAELTADESVSAFLDDARDAFIGWPSTMGSDPHAARPGVVGVRPSTPAPAAAAQAVAP